MTENEDTEETEAQEAVYADVTVSGNVISYSGAEITAADMASKAKELGDGTIVRIKDDGATVTALDGLKAALDAEGIAYIVE